ncbi:hypothetical protein EXS57_01680 [Candidatus Kaiserbacteria bacterium]|nr:hypothetical protein [Candidatus Kaiserbacteria bacterium]
MKITFLSDDFPPQSFGGAGISTYELVTYVHLWYVLAQVLSAFILGVSFFFIMKLFIFKRATILPDTL